MLTERVKFIIKEKCPKCEKGDVFASKGSLLRMKMPVMKEKCEHCGHIYEIETGFFWGSMYVSYALTVAESILLFLAFQLVASEMFDPGVILVIAPFLVLTVFFNYRISRMIWMYCFTAKSLSA